MKGKIITGRSVLVEDMRNQGLLSLNPNLPPKTKNSRYWRQKGKDKFKWTEPKKTCIIGPDGKKIWIYKV